MYFLLFLAKTRFLISTNSMKMQNWSEIFHKILHLSKDSKLQVNCEYLLSYLHLETLYCIFDSQKKIFHASLGLEEYLQKKPQKLEGNYFYSFFDPNWCGENLQYLADSINNGEIYQEDILLLNKQVIHAKIIPQNQENGTCFYFFLQKKVEEVAIKNTMNLVPFFQDLTHYLETIDNNIKKAELLLTGDRPQVSEALSLLHPCLSQVSNAKNICRWMKNIQETNPIIQVNLRESLIKITELFQQRLKQKNIHLRFDLPAKSIIHCMKNDWYSILSEILGFIVENSTNVDIQMHFEKIDARRSKLTISPISNLQEKILVKIDKTLLEKNTLELESKDKSIAIIFSHSKNESIPRIAIWDDVYKLHLPKIDDQHMGLFDSINNLHYVILSNDVEKLSLLLEKFEDYIHVHFQEEETFMREIQYPKLREHRMQHELFKNKIQELREQSKEVNNPLEKSAMLFFRDWLFIHIKIHDREYADYNCRS